MNMRVKNGELILRAVVYDKKIYFLLHNGKKYSPNSEDMDILFLNFRKFNRLIKGKDNWKEDYDNIYSHPGQTFAELYYDETIPSNYKLVIYNPYVYSNFVKRNLIYNYIPVKEYMKKVNRKESTVRGWCSKELKDYVTQIGGTYYIYKDAPPPGRKNRKNITTTDVDV